MSFQTLILFGYVIYWINKQKCLSNVYRIKIKAVIKYIILTAGF